MKAIAVIAAAASVALSAPATAKAVDQHSAPKEDQHWFDGSARDACRGQWRAMFTDWVGAKGNPNGAKVWQHFAERYDIDLETRWVWFVANCPQPD